MVRARPEYVVALDLGSTAVRCLIAEACADDQLKVAGLGEQLTNGFQKGEVDDLGRAAGDVNAAVRAAEVSAGVDVETVFVGVGSCHTRGFNSRGCIPIANEKHLIGDSDRRKALKAAQSVFLPSDRQVLCAIPQRYCLDHLSSVANPVGMTATQLEAEVHLVTDATAMMRNVAKAVEQSDYAAEGFLFEPLATAAAVLTEDERQLGSIFIDIGSWSTDVLFYSSGYPRYSQILPVGGHHITSDIALGLNLSLQEAERVKVTLASADHPDRGGQCLDEEFEAGLMDSRNVGRFTLRRLNEIVQCRVEDIFALARRGLDRAGIDNYPRAGVVLSGGSAHLRGLVQKARNFFCAPARLGRPQILSEREGVSGSLSLAAAVGLLGEGLKRRREQQCSPRKRKNVLAQTVVRFGDWIRNTF